MLVASTRRGHVRLRMRAARELTGQRRAGAVARVTGDDMGCEVGVGADMKLGWARTYNTNVWFR